LVSDLWRRLDEHERGGCAIDKLYADEVQDFTQAEVALLVRLCRDPYSLFLCGDSAQTIARGVGFRFKDLRTIWKQLGLGDRTPPKPKSLLHNYRSHQGCLRLAAAVVRVIYRLFPNSIDNLPPDAGVLDGPKPVLIEETDTRLLLKLILGNIRTTAAIEFGAHQVVLVRDDAARRSLPAELKLALVLTVYEAKGLEFDDVLLYNFFADSPAEKEWRVVRGIAREAAAADAETSGAVADVSYDEMAGAGRRELDFDADAHKLLESELKCLYTAITRSRVNVWIFDRDKGRREAMFDAYRGLDLVKVIGDIEAEGEAAGVFAKTTTPKEWRKRAFDLRQKASQTSDDDLDMRCALLNVAVQAFESAGEPELAARTRCEEAFFRAADLDAKVRAGTAAEGRRRGGAGAPTRLDVRKAWDAAARECLTARQHRHAGAALFNARQYDQAGRLHEALAAAAGADADGRRSDLIRAADAYARAHDDVAAARCFTEVGDLKTAIRHYRRAGLYDEAIRLEEQLAERGDASGDLIELIHLAAKQYARVGDRARCALVLQKMPSSNDRVRFLAAQPGLEDALYDELAAMGQHARAAKLFAARGDFERAAVALGDSKAPEATVLEMECRGAWSRLGDAWGAPDATLEAMLERVVARAGKLKKRVLRGDAMLLLGRLRGDSATVAKAV